MLGGKLCVSVSSVWRLATTVGWGLIGQHNYEGDGRIWMGEVMVVGLRTLPQRPRLSAIDHADDGWMMWRLVQRLRGVWSGLGRFTTFRSGL
ncbi:hypothetical protein [Candidatus Hodgkinia cicadicola]|uniref:hypothetical protein n=1 Tax=Candidatus Hodgkinia cicadicola TaxID=573658 RepID=UPI001788D322